jgi:hypothetical protein
VTAGPTQNYDDASLGVWKSRPIAAATTRALIAVGPVVLSIGIGLAAAHWFPPSRLGMNPWLWLFVEIACATAVLVLATRLASRLVPLTVLLRLTTFFPDRAPSRLAVAMRHYSPDALHRVPGPERDDADRILNLVAAVSAHDPLTRSHSERVQAYSALIGQELGLSEHEAARLSWAALLHDVGKLQVPSSVLSKPGQPSTKEWAVLAVHPGAGMEIAEPLRAWLGPWLDVIGQHHERWDGGGYPRGLAGEEISQGARIVAVADAYDAITSARSYKKALPASAARAELARCAGQQFDPQVVRAFLAVGLGPLRRVAGPLSLLSALPGVPFFGPELPSLVQKATTAGALKAAGAIGVVLTAAAVSTGAALAQVPPTTDTPAAIPAGAPAIATPGPGQHIGPATIPLVAEEPTDDAPRDEPPAALAPIDPPPGPASPPPAPPEAAPPLAVPTAQPPAPSPAAPPTPAEVEDDHGNKGKGGGDGGKGKG